MATLEAPALMTAEQFALLPPSDRPRELVRGVVVEMNPPFPRHGQVCYRIAMIVGRFVDDRELGHIVTNDAGVITERNPDSVRGPDVAFFSYARVPKGQLPFNRYLDVAPDVAFEVFSSDDRWSKMQTKVGEYLAAGVRLVCVLEPAKEIIYLASPEAPPAVLSSDDTLEIPEIADDFRVPVRAFFE